MPASRAHKDESSMDLAAAPALISDDGGKAPHAEAAIEISGVSLRFDTSDGPVQALSDVDPQGRAGRVRLLHRTVGLRQDDASARGRGSRDPDQRRNPGQRHEPARGARQARLRLCVPGPGPLSMAQRRAQYRAAARNHGLRQGRTGGARRQGARARQPFQVSAPNIPGNCRGACSSARRSRARSRSIPIFS